MAMRSSKKMHSPFFIKHSFATVLITALICVLSYFFFDKPLAEFFKTVSPPFKIIMQTITDMIDPKHQYFFWPILFFALRYYWKKDIWANRALLILVSIPLANLFVEIIKCIAGRARPDLFFTQGIYGFTFFSWNNSYLSFPSGHSCTIGAICGALACFYPRKTLPLTILALALAFSRVALTFHFLSDIIAGVAFGMIVAQWTFVVMKQKPFQFVLR